MLVDVQCAPRFVPLASIALQIAHPTLSVAYPLMGKNRKLLILQSNGAGGIASWGVKKSELELVTAPNLHEIVLNH
jgi:hypothetical protein